MNKTLQQALAQTRPWTLALWPAVLFLVVQGLVGVILMSVGRTFGGGVWPTWYMALSLILSGVLAIVACRYSFSMPRFRQTFALGTVEWRRAPIAFVGAVAIIFATNLMSEQFDLPNLLEDTMLSLGRQPLGILAIAVTGPVAEEYVFREAILGGMLRRGVSRWGAILFSALLFGLVHLNPAQIPFAFAIGIALGFIYVRTGNIVISSIIHIFNNGFAVVEMWILGKDALTFSYTDHLGGAHVAWILSVVLVVVGILLLRFVQKRPLASAGNVG